MRVLVTGATGFVGSRVCDVLQAQDLGVVAAVRNANTVALKHVQTVHIPTLDGETDWHAALKDVDAVVHCAARAHVMREDSDDPLSLYLDTNRDATLNLARQAAEAGVKRFVFLSSIKVHGEETQPGEPWTEKTPLQTDDPYGLSKAQAEEGLQALAQESAMEIVIIRPPLIYGPGVKANFASLMNWVKTGRPLPLGGLRSNRRSLVALDNLVDLIRICLTNPKAAGQTFLVSDGEDLSTAALIERMGMSMGRKPRLLPIPASLLKLGATLINRPGIYQRLGGSLQLDITHTRETLDWTPPLNVDEGLRRAAEG